MTASDLDIFLVGIPGLESCLAEEAREQGFSQPVISPGGVTVTGGWPDVWRANVVLRGASRVLVRIGSFRAMHLAQLDKRARKFPWADTLRADIPLKVETTCKRSRIYHAGAATQRMETAIRETLGAPISKEASLVVKVRIDDDLCTISLDTSGEPLHRRGHKQAIGKAPMRETLAALFLRQCGYDGSEPLVDPMCGSGTFVIEAAEIAAGLLPGRSRAFAFEQFANASPAALAALRKPAAKPDGALQFFGSDRDAGAVRMATENAERAGVGAVTRFDQHSVSDLMPPDSPPGLVMVNPPYGARIGNKKLLYAVYGALGKTLKERFSGWRVGLVTSERGLAKATALPFAPLGPNIPHGGLGIALYQTGALR